MSVRESFAARFGEDQADAIEQAAEGHKNGVHDNKGSDPFKWAIAITIGYECWSKDGYRKHHGITAPADEIAEWIKSDCDLGTHDGDVDFLAVFAGSYNDYVPSDA